MLTGPELGKAIDQARQLKGMSKAELARAFKVTPPSVQDWIKFGRIDKGRLNDLFALFADVVGPEHWGLSRGDVMVVAEEGAAYVVEVKAKTPDPARNAWISIFDEMDTKEEQAAALAVIKVFKATYRPQPQAGPLKRADGGRDATRKERKK